jgi:hypothetical protein
MPISDCVKQIKEIKDSSENKSIIDSASAALTTLHILYDLGFNEVSLEENTDEQ